MPRALRVGFILVVVTLCMVVAAEFVARLILWRPDVEIAGPVGFGFSLSGMGDLLPNVNSVERILPTRPYLLQTNSVGLRNIDEINPDESVFRVLAIGDSFTYGYYVHNQEAWPSRLEETLNQRLDTRFQVFNAGVPGYTIADELDYLRDKGLRLEPDLVVLGFYTNDVFDFYPQIREYFARPVALAQSAPEPEDPYSLAVGLRQHSALYNALRRLRAGYTQNQLVAEVNRVTPTIPGLQELYRDMIFLNPGKPEYELEWTAYDQAFRETVDLLNAEGIPFVLMAFPDLAQLPLEGGLPDVPQQHIAGLTTDTATPYLDLLPVYRAAGDVQSLYLIYYNPDAQVDPFAPDSAVMIYSGDGHPSPYGHLVAARALADLLIERGLLPS